MEQRASSLLLLLFTWRRSSWRRSLTNKPPSLTFKSPFNYFGFLFLQSTWLRSDGAAMKTAWSKSSASGRRGAARVELRSHGCWDWDVTTVTKYNPQTCFNVDWFCTSPLVYYYSDFHSNIFQKSNNIFVTYCIHRTCCFSLHDHHQAQKARATIFPSPPSKIYS